MSDAGERIEELKPIPDLVDQGRPEIDEADDPEHTVSSPSAGDASEADVADVAEQRLEVPIDDEDVRE